MNSFKRNISWPKRVKYNYFQFTDHFFGRKRAFKFHEKSRRRFYQKLHADLKKSGPGKVIEVERRSDLSLREFKKKYVRKGIPVILEGAAKDWPCVKNWSLNYFQKLHGNDKVVLVDQIKMADPYKEITLHEIIEGIKNGKGEYYRFYPLLERHPEHLKDFDYKFLRERRNRATWFEAFQVFIGGNDTVTPLHNANQCNLFVQTHGEKKWMLYPNYYVSIIDPDPVRNVYRQAPFKKESGPFDPFDPDYETPYTLYQYIDSYSVHLKPGDILWNPPFWWHAVKNVGNSIGVGYRWLPPFYCFRRSFAYSFLDMCARNPPVWKAYKLYRKDVNLIHLAEYDKLDEYLSKK